MFVLKKNDKFTNNLFLTLIETILNSKLYENILITIILTSNFK